MSVYEAPHREVRYAAATSTGGVWFTKDAVDRLSKRGPLTVEEARSMARDLALAANAATEAAARKRGEHLWTVISREGDMLMVRHRGDTAVMRPITNGVRARGRTWKCNACGCVVASGVQMYVCAKGRKPWGGNTRICVPCLIPDDPIDRIAALADFVAQAEEEASS